MHVQQKSLDEEVKKKAGESFGPEELKNIVVETTGKLVVSGKCLVGIKSCFSGILSHFSNKQLQRSFQLRVELVFNCYFACKIWSVMT